MRCFPNVRQADKNKKPIYNDIVKGCKVLLRIRDENASEEGKAKELHLVSNISVAEVDVDKPRRKVIKSNLLGRNYHCLLPIYLCNSLDLSLGGQFR